MILVYNFKTIVSITQGKTLFHCHRLKLCCQPAYSSVKLEKSGYFILITVPGEASAWPDGSTFSKCQLHYTKKTTPTNQQKIHPDVFALSDGDHRKYDIKSIIRLFSQEFQQDAEILLGNQKNNSDPTNLTHLSGSLCVKGVNFHLQCEYIRLKGPAHRSTTWIPSHVFLCKMNHLMENRKLLIKAVLVNNTWSYN